MAVGAAGIGAGLLVGGVGLAIYSLGFASDRPGDRAYFFRRQAEVDADGLSIRYAITALVVGALVVAAVVIAVKRPQLRWPWKDRAGPAVAFMFLGGVAVLPIMALTSHLAQRYAVIRWQYPLFESLPTAIGAGVLVVAATILSAGVLRWPQHVRVVSVRSYGVLAAVGLLISVAVTVVAVRAGDDDVRVDHTTASVVAVAPVPSRLGSVRYRIQAKATDTAFGVAAMDVVPGGAGFVAAAGPGLTAYDGVTGKPRWHYLRIQPDNMPADADAVRYSPDSLHSLDNGTVVIAHWEWLGWQAFDAMTGRILWKNSDFTHDYDAVSLQVGEYSWPRTTPEPLIGSDDTRVMRYDARTGARMWSATVDPSECADSKAQTAITDTSIYRVTRCQEGNKRWVQVDEIDSATGTVVHTRTLGKDTGLPEEGGALLSSIANTVVISWFPANASDFDKLVLTGPHQLTTASVTSMLHTPEVVASSLDNTQQVKTDRRTPNDAEPYVLVATATGAQLYRLPGFINNRQEYRTDVIFLEHELIQVTNYTGPRERAEKYVHVRSWSRVDGHPLADHQLGEVDAEGNCIPRAIAVPGGVLAFCHEPAAEIVGFSSGA
ncbi:PQQ-binding-like beta-propeller repeat protein [Nocardia macrotermitis]|uniref:PQQ-binding-like beta-propeller repeat protein n=1 Tax=Nocardia macrotermitis TaxID=2585198 RepID=UPI0018860345|nr:PQQ-binding-like beta-propeller repeat protein [Nocardia macrotermitis]